MNENVISFRRLVSNKFIHLPQRENDAEYLLETIMQFLWIYVLRVINDFSMKSALKTRRVNGIELLSLRLINFYIKSLVQSHRLDVFEGLDRFKCNLPIFFLCGLWNVRIFNLWGTVVVIAGGEGGKADFVCVTIQFTWFPLSPPSPLRFRSYLMIPP